MAKGYKGGFQRGGGFGDPMGMIQQLQKQLNEAQQSLEEELVTATVGGGAVKVTMTGSQVCKSVEISPSVFEEGDVEMLQDLILAAFQQAQEKAKALTAERLGPLTAGLGGLPGLF
jgi:DNA-binding YbaB/EbfC family protein